MSRPPAPPRLARRILEYTLPADVRDDIPNDLAEVFQRQQKGHCLLRARLWYWREVLFFSWRFLWERFRERGKHTVRSSARRVAGRSRESGIVRVTGASILDFKLGLRMLFKHPGLTLAGGLGMAVTIATGATLFHFAHILLHAPPELEDVVAIEYGNAATGRGVKPRLSDYATWMNELESLEYFGAFRSIERNLISDNVGGEPVRGAEVTAAAFELMQVPPFLGRPIIRDDERRPNAAAIVLGYDVWHTRFSSDSSIVGRTVRLGGNVVEVVGVMPEGFAFPVNHDFWVPLQTGVAEFDLAHEPRVDVFGRLTPGVSFSSAQAELTTVGIRQANAHPETHEHLRPRLSPYFTYHIGAIDVTGPEVWVPRFFAIIVLLVLSANVAILIYARNATRLSEIGVRSALGASRRRIVMQLFVEALVLAVLAAVAALILARIASGQAMAVSWEFPGRLPFWFDFDASADFFLYMLGCTVLASVIVGVLPALRSTRGDLRSALSQVEGGGGMRMGKTWTTLIVCQVAVCVTLLPAATGVVWSAVRLAAAGPGFAADDFGTARLDVDYEPPPHPGAAEAYDVSFCSRVQRIRDELQTRFLSEPFVTKVAYAAAEPGREWNARIEVEGEPSEPTPEAGRWGRLNMIEGDFFNAFSIPLLEGRRFDTADSEPDLLTVIVDQSFVRLLIGDLDAVGRRIRLSRGVNVEPGSWHTIVGVVGDFPTQQRETPHAYGTVYISGPPATSFLLLWKGSPSESSLARLRDITLALDPTLRLSDVESLAEVYRASQPKFAAKLLAWTFALMMVSVLLLSTAGVYALTSLAVTMRRREIGIRAALGANRHRLLISTFSRAGWQLALGVLLGTLLAIPIARSISGYTLLDDTAGMYAINVLSLLPWVAVVLVAAGLAGVLGPARRGLSIEPSEALRAE